MEQYITLNDELRHRVLQLSAEYYTATEIKGILDRETGENIPIEVVRRITNNPQFRTQKQSYREVFNKELQDEVLASKRKRVQILQDLLEEADSIKKDSETPSERLAAVNLKKNIVVAADKIVEDKNKTENKTLIMIFDKVDPYYIQQYLDGKVDRNYLEDLVARGEGFNVKRRIENKSADQGGTRPRTRTL